VQRAQAQMGALTPLLEDCDRQDNLAAEIAGLNAQQEALKYYFADVRAGLLGRSLAGMSAERDRFEAQRQNLESRQRQSPAADRAWYHCSFGSLNQMVMAGE
jgi:uncharacterized protein YPO0396